MENRTVLSARTLLFVPGNRPDRFSKALVSGADAVILDLEDAVPDAEKEHARRAIYASWESLRAIGVPTLLRVNTHIDGFHQADLELASSLRGLDAVMLPKADSRSSLEVVAHALPGIRLVPLIETAARFEDMRDLAQARGVVRLAIGHIDFLADTGITCSEDASELNPLRFAVAVSTRVNGLAPAIDSVTPDIKSLEKLRTDTERLLRFGFGGKLCIHPEQVAPVHNWMHPSESDLSWARRVVEASARVGGAAVQLDGRMVDAPVVLQARRILDRAATQ